MRSLKRLLNSRGWLPARVQSQWPAQSTSFLIHEITVWPRTCRIRQFGILFLWWQRWNCSVFLDSLAQSTSAGHPRSSFSQCSPEICAIGISDQAIQTLRFLILHGSCQSLGYFPLLTLFIVRCFESSIFSRNVVTVEFPLKKATKFTL